MVIYFVVGDNLRTWDAHLPQAEFAHNSALNRSTGLSPFQVVYGIVPRGPADLLALPLPIRTDVYATELMEALTSTHAATRIRLEESNT